MRGQSLSERRDRASVGQDYALAPDEGAYALIMEEMAQAYLERSIALGHLAALAKLAELRRAQRIAEGPGMALTASAAHLREYGHALAYGCCRPKA